jgi:membrane fusion protein (multidrug efflux system)
VSRRHFDFLSWTTTSLAVALALVTVVAAGCSNTDAAGRKADAARPKPLRVDTLVVAERQLPSSLQLAGSLKANQESDVAANASGRVLRTMVERGSFVAAGAPLAQLDTRMSTLFTGEAKANFETARQQRALAEADCARYDKLAEKGAISRQELDRVTSTCKTTLSAATAAESRAEQALQTLGDATIRAPFPGLVAERFVSVGEYVRPDTKVAHVVDIDPLRLELTLPEQSMGAVKMGQKVQFQVSAFPDRTFEGTVRYIGPSVRAATRDLVFEALVTNKGKLLRPGLFATARLDAATQSLPVVPKSALKPDGDSWRIFVVVGKQLEERIVQTAPAPGGEVAIVSGLKAGERVVAHPSDQIVDGLDVE